MEVKSNVGTAIHYAVRAAQCRAAALIDTGSAEAWEGTAEWCREQSAAALGRGVNRLENWNDWNDWLRQTGIGVPVPQGE
jgi:hypothetical protein